jgi:hypothetical protein
MARCIHDLTGAGIVPVLDATPAGRAVYLPLGFQDAWGFHRWAGRGAAGEAVGLVPPAGVAVRPIDDATFAQLARYDATIFGADRGGVLARLRARVPEADLVAMRDGRVCGFMLGRDGRTSRQLGPLVADDTAIAQALLAHGLAAITGPVYVDLADAQGAIRAWLTGRGFAAQRPLTRMLYRRATSFDDTARTFAVAGPELG